MWQSTKLDGLMSGLMPSGRHHVGPVSHGPHSQALQDLTLWGLAERGGRGM